MTLACGSTASALLFTRSSFWPPACAGLPFRDGVHAACHALLNVLPLFLMCNPSDMGAGGLGHSGLKGSLLSLQRLSCEHLSDRGCRGGKQRARLAGMPLPVPPRLPGARPLALVQNRAALAWPRTVAPHSAHCDHLQCIFCFFCRVRQPLGLALPPRAPVVV